MEDKPREMEAVAALLHEENTLALATTDAAGEACIAPLFYVADDNLSLYWLSSEDSTHSVNAARAAHVSVAVFRHSDNWKAIRGVQMRGPVGIIADKERRSDLIKKYCQRFKLGPVFRVAISRSALYVFAPEFIRLIDNSKTFAAKVEFERAPSGSWHRKGSQTP